MKMSQISISLKLKDEGQFGKFGFSPHKPQLGLTSTTEHSISITQVRDDSVTATSQARKASCGGSIKHQGGWQLQSSGKGFDWM